MGRTIPYMTWKMKNVWNHQPVMLFYDFWWIIWCIAGSLRIAFYISFHIFTFPRVEFREPWFLEENKWWKPPWSGISVENYLGVKHTPTYKIQTLVVSWGAAFLYVPTMISMISKVISWNSWTPCQPLTRWWLFRPWWHLPGVKTVFAPKTSVSLQLIQEKFVEYWEIQSNM